MAILAGGDFNLHHPLWNPKTYHTQDSKAEELIDLMMQINLNLISPPSIITFPHANTGIELVFGNNIIKQGIIKCRIAKNNDHDSDHLPLETIINLEPMNASIETQQAYKSRLEVPQTENQRILAKHK